MERTRNRRAARRRALLFCLVGLCAAAVLWTVGVGWGMDPRPGAGDVGAPVDRQPWAERSAEGGGSVELRGLSAERAEIEAEKAALAPGFGALRGRVLGLPANVLMRAHPGPSVVLRPVGDRERQPLMGRLESGGRFEIPALEAGAWEVQPGKGATFQLEPKTVQVTEGEVLTLVLRGFARESQEFVITVDRSALKGSAELPFSLARVERFPALAREGLKETYSSSEVRVKVDVFPGPVEWWAHLATIEGVGGAFPRVEAKGRVVVPERRVGGRREPIEVTLVFRPPGPMVAVKGRAVTAGADGALVPAASLRVMGERSGGLPCSRSLTLDAEGHFAFRVNVEVVAGPQISFGEGHNARRLGPFVITGREVDLGMIVLPARKRVELEDVMSFSFGRF